MALANDLLLGIYIGVITGFFPALVAWVLGFVFKYFTGVTLPGFGVVVLGVGIAGVQGGLLGLLDPSITASPATLVALLVVMMLTLYAHAKGDQMGAEFPRRVTLRSLADKTLSNDVVERIGGYGEVRVTAGEIRDIEGSPALPVALRNEIHLSEWRFPADLPLPELEKRLEDRLRHEYGLSEVVVVIDEKARADITAAPPIGGVSGRLPSGKRGVTVECLVPSGLARGDEVVVRTGERDVEGVVVSAYSGEGGEEEVVEQPGEHKPVGSAPTTVGGWGRVTVAVQREDAEHLLEADVRRIVVESRGKRREYELVGLLKQAGKRFSKAVVSSGSMLAGKTISEAEIRESYGVGVLALGRNGDWVIGPRGSTRIDVGDELFVVGGAAEIDGFVEALE